MGTQIVFFFGDAALSHFTRICTTANQCHRCDLKSQRLVKEHTVSSALLLPGVCFWLSEQRNGRDQLDLPHSLKLERGEWLEHFDLACASLEPCSLLLGARHAQQRAGR